MRSSWSSTSRPHSLGRVPLERLTYSAFHQQESIAVVSLLNSTVFKDFPTLRIVCSLAAARFPINGRASRRAPSAAASSVFRRLRSIYYDTVLYSKDSLALLIKTVGADRCMFGTERPGVGTVKDPRTNRWLDETRYIIEDFEWLSGADKS